MADCELLRSEARRRSPQFPDVPTLDELGLTGFEADFGVYAPAGTAAEIICAPHAEINRRPR
ncbi:hypothetical protein AOQ72_12445 [Bradyrhizobium yuanmingense]|uniref:Uncharacterized protein n=1 Tax=Bradyrhizobium yuanmingense TaxID=108015 RepID=A0A0R3CQ91_9BRAD|nr:hypothetical protein AOQ72_12445 [Bradyrhizobium yuanmingense]